VLLQGATRNTHTCKSEDKRTTVQSCDNKCTSATCPVPSSECQQVGANAKCFCRSGFYAQGEAHHATLCVRKSEIVKAYMVATEVVGRCVDASKDKHLCKTYVAHPSFGCNAKFGWQNMASNCRASCGKYCDMHSCEPEYADMYCRIHKNGNCDDTTAIDFACSHHELGRSVPKTCDDASTDLDDQCATVFTNWWKLCQHAVPSRTALARELQGFNDMCQAHISHKPYTRPPSPPPALGGCTYKGASNYNPRATVDDSSCRFTAGSHCPTPQSVACQMCARHGGKCKPGKGHRRLKGKNGRRQLQSDVTCTCPKGYDSRTLCATKTSDQHGDAAAEALRCGYTNPL
jgi:hypothetical protein